MSRSAPIGLIDFETDPFRYGRAPKPFAVEILIGGEAVRFWGKRVAARAIKHIRGMPKCTLYAHNGGRFDFWFLIDAANVGERLKVINGRIAEFKIGRVTLRDSWLLVPVPLAAHAKSEIDYCKFEQGKRDKHKREILDYLHSDCVNTLELIEAARETYGKKLTIGGAAIATMRGMGLKIDKLGSAHDERMRAWYFGGRTQALRSGDHRGDFIYYDINSAYPHAMTHGHCVGGKYRTQRREPKACIYGQSFFIVHAESGGWFPERVPREPLHYPDDGETRRFHVTGWELTAALDAGMRLDRIESVSVPTQLQDYGAYVSHTRGNREACKVKGDELGQLLWKLLGNSGYGKLASNPARHRDYKINARDRLPYFKRADGSVIEGDYEADVSDELALYSVPSDRIEQGFYNVATAASITGFVRARLIEAIHKARNAIYCDTDSLVCKSAKVDVGDKLGQWKVEHRLKRAVVVGRKLYAFQDIKGKWKTASKGSNLTHSEILAVSRGKTVTWRNMAPSFGFGGISFTNRRITVTV